MCITLKTINCLYRKGNCLYQHEYGARVSAYYYVGCVSEQRVVVVGRQPSTVVTRPHGQQAHVGSNTTLVRSEAESNRISVKDQR